MKKMKVHIPLAALFIYLSSSLGHEIHAQNITIDRQNQEIHIDNKAKELEVKALEIEDLAGQVIVLADEFAKSEELAGVLHITSDDTDFFQVKDGPTTAYVFNSSNKNNTKKRFKFNLFSMDVGINGFVDNTDYNSAEAIGFVRISDDNRNEKAFDIRNGQSRNINLWPASFNFDLSAHPRQNVILSLGVPGFQFYSLKYNNPIKFVDGMDPHVIETSQNYNKNKLGITYLSIPVSITGQTKISKSKWVTYGAGIIGGYRIASWTNQKAKGEEKVKVKDPFNLNDYQVAVTGEIGVKGILRLYGTYNLTNMWDSGLDQNLFAVGIRFFGI